VRLDISPLKNLSSACKTTNQTDSMIQQNADKSIMKTSFKLL